MIDASALFHIAIILFTRPAGRKICFALCSVRAQTSVPAAACIRVDTKAGVAPHAPREIKPEAVPGFLPKTDILRNHNGTPGIQCRMLRGNRGGTRGKISVFIEITSLGAGNIVKIKIGSKIIARFFRINAILIFPGDIEQIQRGQRKGESRFLINTGTVDCTRRTDEILQIAAILEIDRTLGRIKPTLVF